MEQETSEQAISHIRLSFPKRIFEVCHLIKRETETDFFALDVEGNFSKHINIARPDEDHVCISLAVDNLTFEANNLCFSVDQVQAKDPEALESLLEKPQHKLARKPVVSTTDIDPSSLLKLACDEADIDESVAKPKKRGRPRKIVSEHSPSNSATASGDAPGSSEKDEDGYLLAPSGRRIRKPLRYRADYHETDDVVDGDDRVSEPMIPGEISDDGEEFDVNQAEGEGSETETEEVERDEHGNLIQGKERDDPRTKKVRRKRKLDKLNTSDGATEGAETSTVVVKKKRGRPPKPKDPAAEPDPFKKPHGSKGVKRPHYKREANIECRLCNNMYKDELSLIAHLSKLHTNETGIPEYIAELKLAAKVSCKICGKVLGNRRNEMVSHMRRVHGKDDDFISKCDECGMEFKRSFLLKEHIRRQHPKHERVLCHLCPATFKLKEYLTEHLKYTHNKQYKWQCDICHKLTSSPKNLRRHKKLHEESAFQCPVCSKLFSEAGNMRRHILYVHNATEVVRHGCPHCDRDFATKHNLITHINMVHMKMTSFYCDICKKYFPRKKQLIDHATIVHPGVPILSTKLDDSELGGGAQQAELDTQSLAQIAANSSQQQSNQNEEYSVSGVPGEQPTIFIQAADGTEHMLVGQIGDGAIQGAQAVDEISRSVQNINMLEGAENGQGQFASTSTDNTGTITVSDNNLSIAQQALAAFEAGGGLHSADFGTEQFLSVIGEDGQEIRVQIVRKEAEDIPPDQLEHMYIQASVAPEDQVEEGSGAVVDTGENDVAGEHLTEHNAADDTAVPVENVRQENITEQFVIADQTHQADETLTEEVNITADAEPVGDQQIEDQQIEDQQIEDQQIEDQQIEDQQIEDQQIEDQQIEEAIHEEGDTTNQE